MPDPIWTDQSVSDLEVRVHGYLVMWNRLYAGRFPRTREVAHALARAECTIRRAMQGLEQAGYLALGRATKASRYTPRLGYRLKTPGARLSAATRPDPQQRLFPDDQDEPEKESRRHAQEPVEARSPARESAQPCALFVPPLTTPYKEERDIDRLAGTREESERSVSIPLPETPKSPDVSDGEYVDAMFDRARELFASLMREEVARAAAEYGCENVELVLEKAERRPEPPSSWAWVAVTLRNMKLENKLFAPMDPRLWMGNYNPPVPIMPVTEADMPAPDELAALVVKASVPGLEGEWTRRFLRSWVAAGALDLSRLPAGLLDGVSGSVPEPAQKKAGRVHSRQTPTRPAGGPSPAALDYTVNGCSRQKKTPSSHGQLPL